MHSVHEFAKLVVQNAERVIVGKRQQLVYSLVTWLCEGHLLLEDVPGVAKTMLARAMAASIGCSFKRIQCTPDLLPGDVTGGSVFNLRTSEFDFRPGPLFANLVLADEINRATPRTQAAFLEAMAEGRITIDGHTHTLQPPFLVIATQNPIDHEGTFPLPEAQLDRFLMRISLGYPTIEDEARILDNLQLQHPIETLKQVVTDKQLLQCQAAVRQVFVDPKIRQYLLQIVHATRQHQHLALGGSPRASLALFRTGQALAAIRGRGFVIPDDIKHVAAPVLGHRLILKPESRLRRVTTDQVVQEVLGSLPIPIVEEPK